MDPAFDAVDDQIDPLAQLVPGKALARTRPKIFSPEPSPNAAALRLKKAGIDPVRPFISVGVV
jgi:hypothetical protein